MKDIQPLIDRYTYHKEVNPTIMRSDVMYLINEVHRLQKCEKQIESISESYYQRFGHIDDDDENYEAAFEETLTRIIEYDKDE